MQPVNGLSLESYLQLHKALTKNGDVVQSVTPIEECYYKISDLRQLLQLHGFTAGKVNRTELLAAMKGQELINPCSLTTFTTDEQASDQQQASTTSSPSLPFTASDVCAVLGMPEPRSGDVQPLQVLQLSSTPVDVETLAPARANGPVADNQPAQASDLTTVAAAATRPAATAAGALAVAVASQQPQHPYSDPVNPPAATTPTQQLHNQHQQQVQLPDRVPNTQDNPQLAAVRSQQQHHTSQSQQHQHQHQHQQPTASTQQQQQHTLLQQQQQQQQQQPPAAAAATATGTLHSLPQGEVLHQLLAALLTCQPPAASSSSMPLQAAAQPQQPASDLLQQLLACAGATGGPRPNISCNAAQQPAAAMPSTAQAAATAVQTMAPGTGQPASAAVAAGAGTTGLHTHLSTHPCKHSDEGTAAAAVALDQLPGPSHTPWLKLQLQWFEASGILAAPAAAAAAAAEGSTGSLLGRRVGFVLLEEMQVAGPRNSILTLPAGVYEVRSRAIDAAEQNPCTLLPWLHTLCTRYQCHLSALCSQPPLLQCPLCLLQGMAVKYLGSSCQFEVCEAGCPGQHEFYRARILPPRVVPQGPAGSSCSAELAASLAQAHAAASGRPVLLILDLHPRLRSHSLEGLMQINTPEQLQVSWCEELCTAPAEQVLLQTRGYRPCTHL